MDEAYERHAAKTALIVCAAISAFILLLTAAVNTEYLWIGLLTAAVTMGIGALVSFFAARTARAYRMLYHLTWDYIKIGTGRSSSILEFRRVRSIETEGDHLILRTRFSRGYVYAPAEDLDQLRAWMQRRAD